ncbi:MAG: hypothetical protein HYX34_07770 [Actinobacteria bacterium]|nr:hypothetical protein [Actinomycetota bacterium]
MRTIIEPFRITSVEPIRLTTRPERERLPREAGWNVFALHAESHMDFLVECSRRWSPWRAGYGACAWSRNRPPCATPRPGSHPGRPCPATT